MTIRHWPLLSALSLMIPGLVSCGKQPPSQEKEGIASAEDPVFEQMRADIEKMEAETEEFREQIARSMNQDLISRMTPEELEAVRSGEITAPDSVEIPPRE